MSPMGAGLLCRSTGHGVRRMNPVQLGKLIRSRQFSVVTRDGRTVKRNGKLFLAVKQSSGGGEKRDLTILNPTGRLIRARNEPEPVAEVKTNKVEELQQILRNIELENAAKLSEAQTAAASVDKPAEESLNTEEPHIAAVETASIEIPEPASTEASNTAPTAGGEEAPATPAAAVEEVLYTKAESAKAQESSDVTSSIEAVEVGDEPANIGQTVVSSTENDLDASITRNSEEPVESPDTSGSTVVEQIEELVEPTETVAAATKIAETIISDSKIHADVQEKSSKPNVIQSRSGAFTMNITNAEESDGDDDDDDDGSDSDSSSSSDSSSDSSSSDSEDDIPLPPPTEQLGRTQLDKPFLGTAIKKVSPHVPLIRFRKAQSYLGKTQTAASKAAESKVVEAKREESVKQTSLDWWERPSKYSREEISDLEIGIINSGGADRIFQ